MISSECDQRVGLWDERFFLYSEETDFAARARSLGFRIKYVPGARAKHTGGGSGISDELMTLLTVNRVRYAEIWTHRPKLFWATVLLHELLRAYSRRHRMTLRVLVQRSKWADITLRLKGLGTDASEMQSNA
jgi:N-acetylglucosaminyl-diphospho-decaprenol L-rhamnosyltransferase